MTTVGIVTPWIGHPELLAGYAAAVAGADEVVIVHNGGDSGIYPAAWTVITPREPHGFAGSNNLGMTFTTADVVVFVNNDVEGDPAWLDRVRADVAPGGLFGPSVGHQRLSGVPVPYVEGWCVAATRETWERVGPWDAERFPKPYWEDVELSIRAVQRDVTLHRAPWPLRHLGGVSTSTVPGAWDGFEGQREVLEREIEAMLP